MFEYELNSLLYLTPLTFPALNTLFKVKYKITERFFILKILLILMSNLSYCPKKSELIFEENIGSYSFILELNLELITGVNLPPELAKNTNEIFNTLGLL